MNSHLGLGLQVLINYTRMWKLNIDPLYIIVNAIKNVVALALEESLCNLSSLKVVLGLLVVITLTDS